MKSRREGGRTNFFDFPEHHSTPRRITQGAVLGLKRKTQKDMRKSDKTKAYNSKYTAVLESAKAELQDRGIWRDEDAHILEHYASEFAFAHVLGKQLEGLDFSGGKEDQLTHVRIARIRNAHINTANQLARTLKLGPYGRKRFNDPAERTPQPAEQPGIMHLVRKAK